MSKLKVIFCDLRLKILIENELRVQKSALVSKRKALLRLRGMQSTIILKGVRVQKSALVRKRQVMLCRIRVTVLE